MVGKYFLRSIEDRIAGIGDTLEAQEGQRHLVVPV
jgi:hypothetical protein